MSTLPTSGREAIARASLEPSAQARDLGDLFEYKLTQPITIRKNQSALVPILQTAITAEKVSLWSPTMGSARPLRAVWLTNSSALTLDGGSFNVIEGEVFAGEGLMEPIKPGEKRLLSYAADLAMRVDARQESERQRVTHVRMLRGVMVQSRQEVTRRIYTVRNEDSSPRALVIEHPVRSDWKLAGETQPEETSLGFHRFRLQVEAKTTATLTVTEVRPIESRININSVDEDQVRLFLTQRSISDEMEAALRDILAQKKRIGELEDEVEARNEAMQKIFDDQQRVRENLKALRGSSAEKALIQRYTRQLDEQENTLARLRAELAALEKHQAETQAALEKTIESLTLEARL